MTHSKVDDLVYLVENITQKTKMRVWLGGKKKNTRLMTLHSKQFFFLISKVQSRK